MVVIASIGIKRRKAQRLQRRNQKLALQTPMAFASNQLASAAASVGRSESLFFFHSFLGNQNHLGESVCFFGKPTPMQNPFVCCLAHPCVLHPCVACKDLNQSSHACKKGGMA